MSGDTIEGGRTPMWTDICFLLLLVAMNAAQAPAGETAMRLRAAPVRSAIRALVERSSPPADGRSQSVEQRELSALYLAESFRPLWVNDSGRCTPDTWDALALLAAAGNEGLEPGDYGGAPLQDTAADVCTRAPRLGEMASFDVAMTVNVLRYFRHLRFGRVDPAVVGFRMPPRGDEGVADALRMALASHRLGPAAAEFRPTSPLYDKLRGALIGYRALAVNSVVRDFLPPRVTLRPGDRSDDLPPLYRFLVALGDLSNADPDDGESAVYEGSVVNGIKRFQIRHGLLADGVIGESTRAALSVPISWRVRQIELALERLRWLPPLDRDRFLAVNIPMFRIWGVGNLDSVRVPSFISEVIVGRAFDTRTPVLLEEMEYVIFRPYWNVPSSILRNEILPVLKRTPDYLQRHDMEIVSGQSDGASAVPVTAANLERLRLGNLRVRQRPGPKNALGLVKFVFPNDAAVYMHGTPAPELFNRARRDLSHGCIRVADPVGLALWVLADEPGWTRERVLSAMDAKAPLRVDLARPIQVILFYMTAIVMPNDGTVHFADDIYGHDVRLDGHLMRRDAS